MSAHTLRTLRQAEHFQEQEGLGQFGLGGLLEVRSLQLPVHELGVGAHVDPLNGLITLQMIIPTKALGRGGAKGNRIGMASVTHCP